MAAGGVGPGPRPRLRPRRWRFPPAHVERHPDVTLRRRSAGVPGLRRRRRAVPVGNGGDAPPQRRPPRRVAQAGRHRAGDPVERACRRPRRDQLQRRGAGERRCWCQPANARSARGNGIGSASPPCRRCRARPRARRHARRVAAGGEHGRRRASDRWHRGGGCRADPRGRRGVRVARRPAMGAGAAEAVALRSVARSSRGRTDVAPTFDDTVIVVPSLSRFHLEGCPATSGLAGTRTRREVAEQSLEPCGICGLR